MGERSRRAGAPFYAPPRKTSAEIISEARAAITADMIGAGAVGLRPLRTRRPFTPREPQRTLLSDTRRHDPRPTSGFDLKYQTVQEGSEVAFENSYISEQEEHVSNGAFAENQQQKKKSSSRPTKTIKGSEGWSGFPKLPHLSGKSKPLHRRNTVGQDDASDTTTKLEHTISVTQPLFTCNSPNSNKRQIYEISQITSHEISDRRKKCMDEKSISYDAIALGDVSIKQLAVQVPITTGDFDNMTALEISEALSQKNQPVDRVLRLLDALEKTIAKSSPGESLRDLVLRALLSRARDEDDRILVTVARIMLMMRVTGAHLTAACKLVFRIASNDKNDRFFKNGNLLELVVESCARACPLTECSSVLHAMGALRVLALEPSLAARGRSAGALHLAVLHLKIINNAKAERPRQVTEEATHALYQLTGALRNLAGNGESEGLGEGEGDTGREFADSGAIGELLNALTLHTDRDVLTNVARCLSVLSSWPACLKALCSCPGASRALLSALGACAARAALAVRLAYTLGNMAAHCDRARMEIYHEKGSIDVLLTILESYTQRNNDTREHDNDPDLHLIGSDLGGSDGSNEDVLIKTVRVVANLCLTEEAGSGLVEHAERTVKAMLSCLEVAASSGETGLPDKELASCVERREELATAALATINNITFYFDPSTSISNFDILDQLVKVTCTWLSHDGLASHEAVRALGNLTRCDRAARAAVLYGALDALPPLHIHAEADVRIASAGVLVNVCGAEGAGGAGAGEAAARALVAARHARDVPSAALLARAVWNAHEQRPLGSQHAKMAAAALASFLEDESLFSVCEATNCGDRRASDPEIMKNHSVKFDLGDHGFRRGHLESKLSYSVEEHLHLEEDYEDERERWSGSDLGFEEGSPEPCPCGRCSRAGSWSALTDVALPLLQRLLPARRDAAVGTEL